MRRPGSAGQVVRGLLTTQVALPRRLRAGRPRVALLPGHAGFACSLAGPGRGKTHLATAMGVRAVSMGRPVRFHSTARLVMQLERARADGKLDGALRDAANADLVILDEFGYVPIDVAGASCSSRWCRTATRRSLVITTNIEVREVGHGPRRRQARRGDVRPVRTTAGWSSSTGRATAWTRRSCSLVTEGVRGVPRAKWGNRQSKLSTFTSTECTCTPGSPRNGEAGLGSGAGGHEEARPQARLPAPRERYSPTPADRRRPGQPLL